MLVTLHALDPVVIGLSDMVRKTGYLERQLRRWHAQVHAQVNAQVHATGAPELALLDELHDLLARRIPPQADGIVHGDYRAGNVAFGPDGDVKAVFDWELATSGDPMADLGWLASTWQDPGEQLPPTASGPSTVVGFPTRAQLVRRYAWRSGRDVSNLPYWVAFRDGRRPASAWACGPATCRTHGRRRLRRQAPDIGRTRCGREPRSTGRGRPRRAARGGPLMRLGGPRLSSTNLPTFFDPSQ